MIIDEFKVKVGDIEYNIIPKKLDTKTEFYVTIDGAETLLKTEITEEFIGDLRCVTYLDFNEELINILNYEISDEIAKLI